MLFGVLFSFLLIGEVAAQVPVVEMNALSALHNSTSGDTWQWRNETTAGAVWNFTLDGAGNFLYDPCNGSAVGQTWQGVKCMCSYQTCHIIKVDLETYALSGFLPPDIADLSFLELLNLADNQLTGSIPPGIGQLFALTHLALNHNLFTGTLPRELGGLSNIVSLYIGYTNIIGTIISQLGQLTTLTTLNLRDNQLSGTIPSEVGRLTSLVYLSFHNNYLTKTIPNEAMGHLTALTYLALSDNELTGYIPSGVGQLNILEKIYLGNNQLNGTIPSEVGQLAAVKLLYLYNNQLTGAIPSEVGKLTALENLPLYINKLTGTIPGEVGNLTALQLLSLYSNHLVGTIPDELWQLTTLDVLALYDNELTGTISSEVGHLNILEYLYLDDNYLTGTIPSQVGQLTALELLYLHHNFLSGPLSSEIGKLTALEYFYCFNNQLTGTIPSTFGNLEHLDSLWLHDNFLVGTLPTDISKMKKLSILFAQNNILTGRIENVFNHSMQLQLNTIDISNNRLTGSLSADIFLLPQIKVLSLSVNCFKEKLSENLCSAAQVEVLSFNGLRAAEGCEDSIMVPLSGVGLFNTIGGTLPSCVWTLRNLSVLHLTGNGLTGELVQSLPRSSPLVDLSLSHNQLKGTIPLDILNIANLDLSYNQLGGEYGDRTLYMSDTNINLEINRLSGQLPVSGLELVLNGSLSILNGNLFSCNSIPENDEYSRDYVCGSRNLNYSLFVFVHVLAIAVLSVVWVCWARISNKSKDKYQHQFVSSLRSRGTMLWTYMTFTKKLNPKQSLSFLQSSAIVRQIAMLSATFIIIIQYAVQLLVVILFGSFVFYVVKALDTEDAYSSHRQTYAWFWTAAYMRGIVPASMLLLLWAGAISACFYCIVVHPPVLFTADTLRKRALSATEVVSISSNIGVAFVANVCVTIAVNAIYIYSTQQSLDATVHFLIQLGLSIFRIMYSLIVFPLLSQSILNDVNKIRFRFFLLTINNLLIPCAVTALTSGACFQGLLSAPEAVATPYSFRTCVEHISPLVGETYCLEYKIFDVESASLVPPFTYNNQCGSVILTSYIPVLLLGYSIQLLLPFIILAPMPYFAYDSFAPFVRQMFHGIIWPEYWLHHNKATVSHDTIIGIQSIYCNDVFNSWLLLLTFGLCSPVLAVAIVCSLSLKMSLWVLLIGRYTKYMLPGDGDGGENNFNDTVSNTTTVTMATASVRPTDGKLCCSSDSIVDTAAKSKNVAYFALTALAEAYLPLIDVLGGGSFWRLLWCSALFVGLVGWDMAIDEVGWLWSLWVPLVPLCYVLSLRYSFNAKSGRRHSNHQDSAGKKKDEASRHHDLGQGTQESHNPLHYEGYNL